MLPDSFIPGLMERERAFRLKRKQAHPKEKQSCRGVRHKTYTGPEVYLGDVIGFLQMLRL